MVMCFGWCSVEQSNFPPVARYMFGDGVVPSSPQKKGGESSLPHSANTSPTATVEEMNGCGTDSRGGVVPPHTSVTSSLPSPCLNHLLPAFLRGGVQRRAAIRAWRVQRRPRPHQLPHHLQVAAPGRHPQRRTAVQRTVHRCRSPGLCPTHRGAHRWKT